MRNEFVGETSLIGGVRQETKEKMMGKGILLWLVGVPIPVIIVLWLIFGH
jgi:hypothetical protein